MSVKPEAKKEIRRLTPEMKRRVVHALEELKTDLRGDVKKLINIDGYRCRVGDYRIIFRIEADLIVIRRVVPRGSAY